MDRERVSLSLKATQEDPWQQFARTHQIGQVVPGQGHQAGAVRRVRPGGRGHRGPGAHLRAGRAPRGDPRAGRAGRRRDLRQGHRHRPGPPPHLPLAQAGQRGPDRRRDRGPVRPGALRHGRVLRRPRATTSTPTASTRRPASGSRATTTSARRGSAQYAEAQARFEQHQKQISEARKADAEAAAAGDGAAVEPARAARLRRATPRPPAEATGTLASDEASSPRCARSWPAAARAEARAPSTEAPQPLG